MTAHTARDRTHRSGRTVPVAGQPDFRRVAANRTYESPLDKPPDRSSHLPSLADLRPRHGSCSRSWMKSAVHANGVFVSEFGDLTIPQPTFDLSSHTAGSCTEHTRHRYGHSSGSSAFSYPMVPERGTKHGFGRETPVHEPIRPEFLVLLRLSTSGVLKSLGSSGFSTSRRSGSSFTRSDAPRASGSTRTHCVPMDPLTIRVFGRRGSPCCCPLAPAIYASL